jgi:predicted RNA-binding Zn-ribbon protein involved in translation (DUF1610 family)
LANERKIRITRKLFTEKLCPKCLGKLRLYGSLSGWATPELYACDKCGYIGYIALEKTDTEA